MGADTNPATHDSSIAGTDARPRRRCRKSRWFKIHRCESRRQSRRRSAQFASLSTRGGSNRTTSPDLLQLRGRAPRPPEPPAHPFEISPDPCLGREGIALEARGDDEPSCVQSTHVFAASVVFLHHSGCCEDPKRRVLMIASTFRRYGAGGSRSVVAVTIKLSSCVV